MRARMILLVLAVLVVAGFAWQNWSQFTEPSTLSFGVVQAQAPLGLLLLGLLGLAVVLFLVGAASMRTRSLMESRQHAKDLHAQRELADKAEASRYTELRQVLDNHLRETHQREKASNTELERSLAQHQRELRNQLEQMYHLLVSRMSELERRMDGARVQRVERVEPMNSPMQSAEPVQPHPAPVGRERV